MTWFKCGECQHEFSEPYIQEHTDLIYYGSAVSSEVVCVTQHCPECGDEDFSRCIEEEMDE